MLNDKVYPQEVENSVPLAGANDSDDSVEIRCDTCSDRQINPNKIRTALDKAFDKLMIFIGNETGGDVIC